MALPTPGYWTLTATSLPSGSTALCTCPIDAAATGTGSQSRNSLFGSLPSCSRTTCSARLGAMGGTSCWRVASASRASSGRPSAMNDTICPSFMMAPFMLPSSRATSSAVLMANCSSSSARRSSSRRAPRTLIAAQWAARRAVSRQTRRWRRKRSRVSSSNSCAAATAAPPATTATATAVVTRRRARFRDGMEAP